MLTSDILARGWVLSRAENIALFACSINWCHSPIYLLRCWEKFYLFLFTQTDWPSDIRSNRTGAEPCWKYRCWACLRIKSDTPCKTAPYAARKILFSYLLRQTDYADVQHSFKEDGFCPFKKYRCLSMSQKSYTPCNLRCSTNLIFLFTQTDWPFGRPTFLQRKRTMSRAENVAV